MKQIPLTQGQFALVDDADFEQLSRFKWHAIHRPGYGFYAARHNTRKTTVLMHRVILGVNTATEVVDHRDGNGLNNQRANVRRCTHADNSKNSRSRVGSSSRYKGVCHRRAGMFEANIRVPGDKNNTYLGSFKNELDAALAYDRAALKYHGEFARTNILNP